MYEGFALYEGFVLMLAGLSIQDLLRLEGVYSIV